MLLESGVWAGWRLVARSLERDSAGDERLRVKGPYWWVGGFIWRTILYMLMSVGVQVTYAGVNGVLREGSSAHDRRVCRGSAQPK